MKEELPKSYDAKGVDSKWNEFWESHGFYHADVNSSKSSYCIVMPPPNITGVLHMGHALVSTLQDILIRWKRMSGFEALWVPGTDHAGIATQTVVEKHLLRTMGKKRADFTRDEFLEHTWKWKEENENTIISQLKKIGCSCDWTRKAFTMDPHKNKAVRAMFKKMYDDGLIYRGDYLVNWDPVTQTAIADDEVDYDERQGFLWHFKYPLADRSGFIQIATTRPETMLGDTAIAVSPKDPRYTHLIGKHAIQPITQRKLIIIADMHVDPEFGTGMVKITPAHDPNDYAMGQTHHLEFVNMMTPDGKINEEGGKYAGMTMEEGRKAIVQEMTDLGLLERVEPHTLRIGVSYRSKAVIEPYISKQWFVKMDRFKDSLRALVDEGKVDIIPDTWDNTYFYWIDNLRDWCISRQLWWGHRIPIWYNVDDPEQMICFEGEGEPEEVKKNPGKWVQDEDVLDTWFSSGLWPFSTLGWPDKTADLKRFYPNSVLVTGHDILFFWVARMLAMGEYAMGQAPFPEVFLHGLIYGKSYWRENKGGGITYLPERERLEYELGKPTPNDVHSRWEKMSKSKGNVIDPSEIIDSYGTDAMRMALCASATQAREIDLDRRRFEEWKNFANKVWNGARFVLMNLDEQFTKEDLGSGLKEEQLGLEDHWILSVLNRTVRDVNEHLEEYAFDQAASEAYDFFWKEFCAYYVEIVKPVLFGKSGTPEERKNKQKILVIVLCQAVRLLHPMAPFITEELFQILKTRFDGVKTNGKVDPYTVELIQALNSKACIVSPFPKVIRASDINPEIDLTFNLVQKVVYAIRNIRGEMKLPPGAITDLHIVGNAIDKEFEIIRTQTHLISALVRTNAIEVHTEEPHLEFASTAPVGNIKLLIPMPTELLQQEGARLNKEKERLITMRDKTRAQLSNEEFVGKAPAALIEKQKAFLSTTEAELNEIENKLTRIGKLKS